MSARSARPPRRWAADDRPVVLVDDVIDHHLRQHHHLVDLPRHVPVFDRVFLGVGGVLLILVGWAMARCG